MNRIKILIADDHELIRRGVRSILQSERKARIVGEAVTGIQVVELFHKLKPDVVIMDVGMPNLNGIEACRQIRAERPQLYQMTFLIGVLGFFSIASAKRDDYLLPDPGDIEATPLLASPESAYPQPA